MNDINTETFGQRVKHIRKSRGLTTRQLAELIHVPFSYLSMIECGNITVLPNNLISLIATKLSCAIDDLIPSTPEENTDDIEINRLAYEALYPEERDRDCPMCGRWRSTQFVSSEGVTYRCASCDDQIYVDETGEFDDDE